MSTAEVEWRRRWKPDLKACPWQPLAIDGDTFMIKSMFAADSYEVLITDLTNYWYESLSANEAKKRTQKLNPSMEAPLTRILDQIKSNLEKPSKGTQLTVSFKSNGDSEKILLNINSSLAGMPFMWQFIGEPADCSMVSEHMTGPLLAMLAEMIRRQDELCKLLQAKDKEIEDYKAQGARTTRKHISTVPFDETAFKNDMVVSKGFEETVKTLGVAAFADRGQELYRQIMTKHAFLTRSPTKRKPADSISDEELEPSAVPQGASGPSWSNRLPPSLGKGSATGPSPTNSPSKTPTKSPAKSPAKSSSSNSSTPNPSPAKDTEQMRREALERRLQEEEQKKQEKAKKKKKIAF